LVKVAGITIFISKIYEARTLGADCILLIAACLSDEQMEDFAMRAIAINMDVLVSI
jgi:indole-3-glycerol phosphate synthase